MKSAKSSLHSSNTYRIALKQNYRNKNKIRTETKNEFKEQNYSDENSVRVKTNKVENRQKLQIFFLNLLNFHQQKQLKSNQSNLKTNKTGRTTKYILPNSPNAIQKLKRNTETPEKASDNCLKSERVRKIS